jgi:outer membrane protein assembly factor BamB
VIAQNLIDSLKSNGMVEIDADDWKKWAKALKVEKLSKLDDPLVIPEATEDPLAMDESTMNPPTPGSNLTTEDNSMLVEVMDEIDYSEWTGNFTAPEKPIVHLQNIKGKFIVAASEDGKVYKFHIRDGKLACVFSKHTEICNSFLYDDGGSVYTVSSDGFLHKIKFKVRIDSQVAA